MNQDLCHLIPSVFVLLAQMDKASARKYTVTYSINWLCMTLPSPSPFTPPPFNTETPAGFE